MFCTDQASELDWFIIRYRWNYIVWSLSNGEAEVTVILYGRAAAFNSHACMYAGLIHHSQEIPK